MGEVGMAMMGSAMAGGADRARIAAQQAVKSPLLEDVNLAGARGVLVNITASAGLKMKEYHEVMNTIKEFTAEDAMVIVGTVIDEAMEDRLRVTMIATASAARSWQRAAPPKLEVLETVVERTGTDNVGVRVTETIDYEKLDQPAVARRRHTGEASRRPRSIRRKFRRSCASRRTDAMAQGRQPRRVVAVAPMRGGMLSRDAKMLIDYAHGDRPSGPARHPASTTMLRQRTLKTRFARPASVCTPARASN